MEKWKIEEVAALQGVYAFQSSSFVKMESLFLFVEFDDGYKVLYDVKDDIKTLPSFHALVDVYGLLNKPSWTPAELVYIGTTR